MDHISENIANKRLHFGHRVHQDCIFSSYNFPLLILLQPQNIANVPKLSSFSIQGFSQLEVKLGFDFPKVSPNQKSRPRCLNFDFDEEINTMLGSLKNSSSDKSSNFLHQKLKMPRIKFCFYRKMLPSMESYPSILFLMDFGERPKK